MRGLPSLVWLFLFVCALLIPKKPCSANDKDTDYEHAQPSEVPEEIPVGFADSSDFQEYESSLPDGELPPIDHDGIKYFRLPDLKQISAVNFHDIFLEHHRYSLPAGKKIQFHLNDQHEEIWDYPVGTRVVHEVYFKSQPPRLYELRMIQKLESGKWAFRSFIPSDDPKTLKRFKGDPYTEENFPPHIHFDLRFPRGPIRVRIARVQPAMGCITCHSAHSQAEYLQTDDETLAGPCGFVPTNESIRRDHPDSFVEVD